MRHRKNWFVRSATIQESQKILEIAAEFFYESDFKSLTFYPEIYHRFILDYIADTNSDVLVVMDDDIIAGYAMIARVREYTYEYIGEMYQFYIRPMYRKTGASRFLVAKIEERFTDWGCKLSHSAADPRLTHVPKNNKMFSNLWKKFGYIDSGILLTKVRDGETP